MKTELLEYKTEACWIQDGEWAARVFWWYEV